MKKWIISITCLSILLLGVLTYQQCVDDIPGTSTIDTFVTTPDSEIYVAQNGDVTSCIYKLDQNGKITEIISDAQMDFIKNQKLMALAYGDCLFALYEKDGAYSLVKFNGELSVDSVINTEGLKGDKVSEVTIIDDMAYITLLTQMNTLASVYGISITEKDAQFQAFLQSEAPENRHFVETCFDGETLTAKYDNGFDNREVREQEQIQVEPDLASRLLVAFFLNETTVITYFIFIFVLFTLLVALLIIILKSRSYGLQRFATVEAVLLFTLIGSTVINYVATRENLRTDRMQYAKYQADSLVDELGYYEQLDTGQLTFCDTEYYQQTYDALFSFVKLQNLESFVEDVAIVAVENNIFVEEVSLSGYYGKSLQRINSEDVENLLRKTQDNGEDTSGYVQFKGREYGAWAITWPNTIQNRNLLLVMVPFDEVIQQGRRYLLQLCIYGSILWLIGTLMLVLISFIEFRSMRRLSRTMEAICQGKQSSFVKPKVMNWDHERMWNSLYEIFKNRERLFYSKNVIFKAFYRFAPKNIEKILNKESVADVNVGDSVLMQAVVGTVAMTGQMSSSTDTYVKSMNRNFDTICKYQIEHDGVMLPSDCNLSTMKVLFANKSSNAIQFGIDTMISLEESGELENQNILTFLHEGNLYYGVSGTEEQAFPYMISREFDCLQEHIPMLRDLGIRMIVTEKLYEDMSYTVASRFIGYVELKKLNKNVKLYEILDAYPLKEKQLRIENRDAFQKALNLYYKNDFYLARNTFTEVVKNCPSDQIARWYLFTCEKMLNAADSGNFKYGLFSE